MSNILEIVELSKDFGGLHAIDNFNLKLEQGHIHGLIGPNGAGKTTIFNNITGVYRPTSGKIFFCGKEITGMAPSHVAAGGIGRTFQNIKLFSNLNVIDNVIIASNLEADYGLLQTFLRMPKYRSEEKRLRKKAMELLQIVGLTDYATSIAASLPYGHQRKLEIARALALNPKLLLLDEPAAGMNFEESLELISFIKKVKEEFDLTILMIEHHMDVVAGLCDAATVLNFGKTLAEGSVEDVKKEQAVIDAYLGVED